MGKCKKSEIRPKRGILFCAAVLGVTVCAGCTTNVYNTGANARFELSPARNVMQNGQIDVMNGLSTGLPSSWFDKSENSTDDKADTMK